MAFSELAKRFTRRIRRMISIVAFVSGSWAALFVLSPDKTPWIPSIAPFNYTAFSFLSSGETYLTQTASDAASQHGVDPHLIKAMVSVESGYRIFATSPKGARGPMQLMPETARELGVRNIYDPSENIYGGVRYFRLLLDRFDNDVELALAAYNAGPKAVRKHKGIPPYAETRAYVKKVMDKYRSFAASSL